MATDVLVISPHPDDAEMACGGTIAALAATGHAVALGYLTRGEMGTRGDAITREAETEEALTILGVQSHAYADLPDSAVDSSDASRRRVVALLRQYRPRLVLAPHPDSLHPDHVACHRLVRDAAYLAGLLKIDTGQERFRPESVLFYGLRPEFQPTLLADITATFETKMRAVRAYRSQFHDPSRPDAPSTLLSAPDFLDRLEALARYYGSLAGVRYAEGFSPDAPIFLAPQQLLQIAFRIR